VDLITRIARIVYWYLNTRRSVLTTSHDVFPWENLIFSVVSIALYLLAAFGLTRWLYGSHVSENQRREPTSEQR
jgi:hypothetical protein